MINQIGALEIRLAGSTDEQDLSFTPKKTLQLTHNLSTTGLFDDQVLSELLDNYPAQDIHITTMAAGADRHLSTSNWRVGTTKGLTGEQILTAIRKGRLWLNLKRLDKNAPVYRSLMSTIYEQLAQQLHCEPPAWQSATLLIASPTASVYYHADSIPNLLWHLRGEKVVFVYPHSDPQFAPLEQLEMICAGEAEEELVYQQDFESSAQIFHLKPGQALSWPQHSPHRVVNDKELNVTLSTEHITSKVRNIVNLYRGNRILRKTGLHPSLNHPDSLIGRSKQALAMCQSAVRKTLRKAPVSYDLMATFRVDPNAEFGYRDIL